MRHYATAQSFARSLISESLADRVLQGSVVFWFLVVVAGQLIFAAYIAALYGGATVSGDLQGWNQLMRHGFVDGDPAGNAMIVIHIALAFIITLGGLAQLTPQIRNRWPGFHRYNGRVYLLTAVVMSLGGLTLTWTRSGVGPGEMATSLNGVLILAVAAFTVYYAVTRQIALHQRWAVRLFLLVSGVWFLRLMIFGWIGLHQAPLWLGDNLDGPAGVVFNFAATLLPVAVYEVYLRVEDGAGPTGRLVMGIALSALTLAMAAAIGMTTLILWWPLMS